MRGVDYRAPGTGITLVVAKSFSNVRDADQGLKRVGRFKDACHRVLVEGVSLVDAALEDLYQIGLLDAYRKLSGVKPQLRELSDFKMPSDPKPAAAKKDDSKKMGNGAAHQQTIFTNK